MRIQIYTEGIADVKFLKNYIEYCFFNKKNLDGFDHKKSRFRNEKFCITSIGGKDELENFLPSIQTQYDSGETILFVFDSDYPNNNGGFQNRNEEIENILKESTIKYNLFLFPNNKDDGDLEDLLIQIVKQNEIFECWKLYEDCLSKRTFLTDRQECLSYSLPARKTKIYAYLEALVGKTNKEKELIKEMNRDYKNEAHWNLRHDYLSPLKIFLKKSFLQVGDAI